MRTEIGKIKDCRVGLGGYQDAQIGVSWLLGSDKTSWAVGDFWGAWATKRTEHCQWTEKDRVTELGETVMRLKTILEDAKVLTTDKLIGKPIEVTFDANTLKSWRVLTEVV